jgi:hypothetical protein
MYSIAPARTTGHSSKHAQPKKRSNAAVTPTKIFRVGSPAPKLQTQKPGDGTYKKVVVTVAAPPTVQPPFMAAASDPPPLAGEQFWSV